MVSLTFYGGVNEIGGNKILVEDSGTKVFLDFGQSFSLLDEYFASESCIQPRTSRFGLKDFFEFGLVPKLKGLYNREAVEKTDLKFSEPEFDAVFISHAHFDHVEHLRFLHPEIPVYLGEAAKLILDSTAEMTNKKIFAEDAKINTFRTGKELSVGSITIKPVHVDHSVPGAYGFLVETSEGVIAYTGDFRQHGPRADMSREFVEKATDAEPAALIIEGTRVCDVERRKNCGEEFVRKESGKIVNDANGLVLAMRYPKDLDRFRTFYEIAKESGKTLVISMKTAHLLSTLKDDPVRLPDPFKDRVIKVYCREMKSYKAWEKGVMDNCVKAEYVHENQKNVILELDFYQFSELVDIKPGGGDCIHSMSEPFEEDPISQISDKLLDNWLVHFDMGKHQLHASGHASKSEIFEIAKEINPKRLFPVHTEHPEMFKKAYGKVEIMEKGKDCVL